jgi:hypothetical protein
LEPQKCVPLLRSRLPPKTPLMIEPDEIRDDQDIAQLLGGFRILIRSALSQGRRLRSVNVDHVTEAIQQRLLALSLVYNPAAFVIGPRTAEHFSPYVDLRDA